MRVLVQRVTRASVRVADRVADTIEQGFAVLVGFTHTKNLEQIK